MTKRRSITAMEFLTPEAFRIELSSDGWRLLNPRQLGETHRTKARTLIARAETTLPPVEHADDDPPSLEEVGIFVSDTLRWRITHRRFKHH